MFFTYGFSVYPFIEEEILKYSLLLSVFVLTIMVCAHILHIEITHSMEAIVTPFLKPGIVGLAELLNSYYLGELSFQGGSRNGMQNCKASLIHS